MLGRKELIKKLIQDTEEGDIEWAVTLDKQWVRAEHYISVTPKKNIYFKLVYYTDHPKGTKLLVSFKTTRGRGSTSNELYDIGGKKQRAESRDLLTLIHKILQKAESDKDAIQDIESAIEEDTFNIGDKVEVLYDKNFDIGYKKKGEVVNIIYDDDVLYCLVDFGEPFNKMLVHPDFTFDSDSFEVDGTCWPVEPHLLKKLESAPKPEFKHKPTRRSTKRKRVEPGMKRESVLVSFLEFVG